MPATNVNRNEPHSYFLYCWYCLNHGTNHRTVQYQQQSFRARQSYRKAVYGTVRDPVVCCQRPGTYVCYSVAFLIIAYLRQLLGLSLPLEAGARGKRMRPTRACASLTRASWTLLSWGVKSLISTERREVRLFTFWEYESRCWSHVM